MCIRIYISTSENKIGHWSVGSEQDCVTVYVSATGCERNTGLRWFYHQNPLHSCPISSLSNEDAEAKDRNRPRLANPDQHPNLHLLQACSPIQHLLPRKQPTAQHPTLHPPHRTSHRQLAPPGLNPGQDSQVLVPQAEVAVSQRRAPYPPHRSLNPRIPPSD